MIEHVTLTYETFDGKIFDDEDEAYEYENQYVYDNCSIAFIDKNGERMKLNDDAYNSCSYISVDRSRSKKCDTLNKRFVKIARDYYGWCLPNDILTSTSNKYVYNEQLLKWEEK